MSYTESDSHDVVSTHRLSNKCRLKIGDVALTTIPCEGIGVVRHIDDRDLIIGIELTDPIGNSDGCRDGKRYFQCSPKYGVFVPLSDIVRPVSPEELLRKIVVLNRALAHKHEQLVRLGHADPVDWTVNERTSPHHSPTTPRDPDSPRESTSVEDEYLDEQSEAIILEEQSEVESDGDDVEDGLSLNEFSRFADAECKVVEEDDVLSDWTDQQMDQLRNEMMMQMVDVPYQELMASHQELLASHHELKRKLKETQDTLHESDKIMLIWNGVKRELEKMDLQKLHELETDMIGSLQNVRDVVNQKSEQSNECRICRDQRKDTALFPCGHLLCSNCVLRVDKCPLCRVRIERSLKLCE